MNRVAKAIKSIESSSTLETLLKSNAILGSTVKGKDSGELEFDIPILAEDIKLWSKRDIKNFIKNNKVILGLKYRTYKGLGTKSCRKKLLYDLGCVDITNDKYGKVTYRELPDKEIKVLMKEYFSRGINSLKSEIKDWGGNPKDIVKTIHKRSTPNNEEVKRVLVGWLIECDVALYALDALNLTQLKKLATDVGVKFKNKEQVIEALVTKGWRVPNSKHKEKIEMATKKAAKPVVEAKPTKTVKGKPAKAAPKTAAKATTKGKPVAKVAKKPAKAKK